MDSEVRGPAKNRDEEAIVMVRDLIEALTAISNYCSAMRRITASGLPQSNAATLDRLLENNLAQVRRAATATRGLHALLKGHARRGHGPRDPNSR